MSDESRIREQICATGASLYQRGYTVGAAGNISARLHDGWLITPTDACLGRLDPAELSKVDASGQWVSGGRAAVVQDRHGHAQEAPSPPRPWSCIGASTPMTARRAPSSTRIPPISWR